LGFVLLLLAPLFAIYTVFMRVPNEITMGPVQRIFYFHVTSAFAAFLGYFIVMLASIGYLATRKLTWDRVAASAAEVSLVFLTIVLVTGPLWARPIWGKYWVWQDARLVTTLVMWIYFSLYIFLRRNWEHDPGGLRFASVLGILGFVNVPIVYFSIKWWNYVHPAHVMGPDGGGLDPLMGRAIMVSAIAIFTMFGGLFALRFKQARLSDELTAVRRDITRASERKPAAGH
jgi:heme exporter protein C